MVKETLDHDHHRPQGRLKAYTRFDKDHGGRMHPLIENTFRRAKKGDNNLRMRRFLAMGGMQFDADTGTVGMSSIFLWYGADFVRPDLMPSLMPVSPGRVRDTVAWWLPAEERAAVWSTAPKVEFQSYDWGLACSVS